MNGNNGYKGWGTPTGKINIHEYKKAQYKTKPHETKQSRGNWKLFYAPGVTCSLRLYPRISKGSERPVIKAVTPPPVSLLAR